MTKEEAIRILASSCIPGSKQTEALETLIPELKESEDERIRKDIINLIYWLKGNPSLCSQYYNDRYDGMLDWLEKQKEVDIQWLKSDNVKNPDKPYIDKAGMFYTTDGRMCYASEIEKQKEHQELPLMNGDADLYFDTWRQEVPVPTFRQCFEEGMRYAQRLQKEQKQVDYEAELKKCKDNPLYFYDKYVSIKQKPIEPSNDELERHQKELHDFKVFAAKQAKEHHISFVHDFEWNNFCAELLSYFNEKQNFTEWNEEDEDTINLMIAILRENYSNCLFKTNSANTIRMSAISTDMLIKRIEALRPQTKQEWNEEDEKMLKWAIRIIVEYSDIDEEGSEIVQNWLESLRPQYHGDVTMTEAYKMGLEAGKASSWKPSEEQIDRLFSIVAALRKDYCDDMADFLANLYADLKKLGVKEEPEYYQHFDPDC